MQNATSREGKEGEGTGLARNPDPPPSIQPIPVNPPLTSTLNLLLVNTNSLHNRPVLKTIERNRDIRGQ
jgi:hypothetical protein